MPYITKKERESVDEYHYALTTGQLNYLITKACVEFLAGQCSYASLNEVIGVLECAKQEFYRRMVAPYEDKKKKANGEIY
jgi:hypothetical protein